MRRVSVASTSIAWIGYEVENRVLEIEFRESGEVYRYFDVPPSDYEAFLQAPSKGSYLNQTLKTNGYSYERVR
jgi:hypothetical protein